MNPRTKAGRAAPAGQSGPGRLLPTLVLAVLGACAAWTSRATTFLLEAENLEVKGGWSETTGTNDAARKFLLAAPAARGTPATGAVEIPHEGNWKLWVRAKDFPDFLPGVRTFSVRIAGEKSKAVFGKHGRREFDGWAWEDGGTFQLKGGPALVVLGEDCASSARCDAILITDNMSYKPDNVPGLLHKAAAKKVPLELAEASRLHFVPEPLGETDDAPAALLQNEQVRFSFHRATTQHGAAIAMKSATKLGPDWAAGTDAVGAEGYRVLFRPAGSDPRISKQAVHPTWDGSLSPLVEVRAGGASVRTRLGPATAPWQSGRCFPLRPTSAKQVDERTVELGFPPLSNGQLTVTWRLEAGSSGADVTMQFQPNGPGQFSLGFHAPVAVAPQATDFLLLPFMYHGHRFPEEAVTVLSSITPTPLALVSDDGVSCALVAEPADIPFEWHSGTNAGYALGLRNEAGLAQPFLYAPVLGQRGSTSEGGPVRARFRFWLQRGGWYPAYRRIADEVFGLTDYRRPTTASLSDAALNLLDLMRDEKASGWDAKAKGPWNIESRNIVTHASPLTYLSLYLLTGDEDFYRRFALPSLEYLLSRPGPHFGAEREIGSNYYTHQRMLGPGKFYGASTFASAFAMTHGRSGAFGEFCLDEKGVRLTRGGHVQPFEDSLAVHRLTGDEQWLKAAVAGADKYIAANLITLPTRDLGDGPFVNVSFVPAWEGLLHVYEATGERRFLDAATEGARWLMTTLWTQPKIPAGETTINPGGLYDHARHVWWMGDRLFRLGLIDEPASTNRFKLPPIALPEHRAPAWQVSNVGLGLEQPCTYTRVGTHANITMSIWAANFLRLARETRDPAFRTSARNATIGRFANYPGYYIDGPSDQYQRPDYPLTGPDITSLYVHHIPPFAAHVLDYLFTEVETRSGGEVSFPSVRQCGYVWFDSRMFGHAPGKVHGQPAWPWLHRTAATVDTINVDRVLAHGDGRFHVVLLNQVREPQQVRVTFDEKVLGRPVDGAKLAVRVDGKPAEPLVAQDRSVQLTLGPLGMAALTLDGVTIDVPTHRVAPPANLALPAEPAVGRAAIPGTRLEALGTVLEVPPFTWRDLYVYVSAGIDDCRAATLRYRVGDGPEQEIKDAEYPWEFSARIADTKSPVAWLVDVQLADGTWQRDVAPKPRR